MAAPYMPRQTTLDRRIEELETKIANLKKQKRVIELEQELERLETAGTIEPVQK